MKPLTVLSLFDGISCGRLALQRANIPVAKYYASEIDKYAIQVTQKNFPDTIQIGDVTKIDFSKYAGEIDLLIGGSPCQDLSLAGKREGLNGERSGLFFKYVEALNTIKPKYFLLENNVGMPKEAYEKISELMGCYPIEINSALVSAQNRRRYYWTNIGDQKYNLFGFPTCNIPFPTDKNIFLDDILESGIGLNCKTHAILSSIGRTTKREFFKKNQGELVLDDVLRVKEGTKKGYAEINPGECVDLTHINSKKRRGRAMPKKCNCLQTHTDYYQYIRKENEKYILRKLSPIECERLQTLPDNYTAGLSNHQRYKCIGNGWTVDVIAHIFSFMGE